MKNKLSLAKEFINFETDGNVTELLKEIRRVSLQIETNTSVYDAMDEENPYITIIGKSRMRATPNI